MEFNFSDNKLRKLCTTYRLAQQALGELSAKKLSLRLQQIEAHDNVLQLELGNPHPLSGNRLGEFSLTLHGGCRLVFKPDHEPVPCHENGSIDWAMVTSVIIVFIGDYHD